MVQHGDLVQPDFDLRELLHRVVTTKRQACLSHGIGSSEYLDEIEREKLGTELIGFTGGEPFLNPSLPAMLDETLSRGYQVLVLTNAMKPMHKKKAALLSLRERYGDQLTIRVSIDHYGRQVHEQERGKRSWPPTIEGFKWLAQNGFSLNVASRYLSGEREAVLRQGFARLFAELGVDLDADDPVALMIFPEMDAKTDVPEITEACWGILNKSPADVMCATARMVVKHKGSAHRRIRLSSPARCCPMARNSTSAARSLVPAIPSTSIIRIAPNSAFSAARPAAGINGRQAFPNFQRKPALNPLRLFHSRIDFVPQADHFRPITPSLT
jgi:hypothetical protein